MNSEVLFFSVFLVCIFAILLFDLGVLSKKNQVVSFKEALGWTSVWFTLALLFFVFLKYFAHWIHGIQSMDELLYFNELHNHKIQLEGMSFKQALQEYNKVLSIQYLTGFFIEYSLSADNLFVILLIFRSFKIERKYYKVVLMWGIIGAVIMRFSFIFLGAALIQQFHWVLQIFGVFLVFSGAKMLWSQKDEEGDITPSKHTMVRFVSRFIAVFPKNIKGAFVFRHKRTQKLYITPLLLVLIVVEFSDLIFAVDSVPAIFSITRDPYIVFFANIFAILGLRSLFFLLERVVSLFHLLGYGLAILLIFIGFKLIFEDAFHTAGITPLISLIIIVSILAVSISLSLLFPKKKG